MEWSKLESVDQLSEIQQQSKDQFVLIFKHSTTCSISRTALDRFQRNWNAEAMKEVTPYFLDLLAHRDISNQIAQHFSVEHQSPQLLVIRNGQSVFDRSHFDIDFRSVQEVVTKA
ncbi:MAG TPA: bacillithiol system redox-active protein YtxJ [Cyclobacteriaceae bacterium]